MSELKERYMNAPLEEGDFFEIDMDPKTRKWILTKKHLKFKIFDSDYSSDNELFKHVSIEEEIPPSMYDSLIFSLWKGVNTLLDVDFFRKTFFISEQEAFKSKLSDLQESSIDLSFDVENQTRVLESSKKALESVNNDIKSLQILMREKLNERPV